MTSNAVMFVLNFMKMDIRREDTCTDMMMQSLVFYTVTQMVLKSVCADMILIVNYNCLL